MKEQEIHSIIDDIARDAKVIISEHLHPECDELFETLKQSAKDWEEAGEKTRKVFRDLESGVREYFDKHCVDVTPLNNDYAKVSESEYCVGDEVYFIGDGCAVKDRIVSVKVETEGGYCIDIDDIFRSMTELVERLKEDVHG